MNRVRKNAFKEGTNEHSKQLMPVVVNMTFSIHKELFMFYHMEKLT